jgi:hypothetical protein
LAIIKLLIIDKLAKYSNNLGFLKATFELVPINNVRFRHCKPFNGDVLLETSSRVVTTDAGILIERSFDPILKFVKKSRGNRVMLAVLVKFAKVTVRSAVAPEIVAKSLGYISITLYVLPSPLFVKVSGNVTVSPLNVTVKIVVK